MTKIKSINDALKVATDKLLCISGVVGIAEGLNNGEPCIKVFVNLKTSELEKKLPKKIKGFVVEVVETDEFRSF